MSVAEPRKAWFCIQDAVEIHLLRDIAARSENFFQAASVVQDLRGVLARTYTQVKALRKQVCRLPIAQSAQPSTCDRGSDIAAASCCLLS